MRVLLWQQVTRDLDLKMIGDTPVVVVLQILSLRSISHKNRRARYIPQSPPLSKGVIQGGWAPPKFWNNKNKCVFSKRTVKVCVSCSWQSPGTFVPSAAHLMVSLFLCRSGRNAQVELRGFEGCRVISKCHSKGFETETKRCWEEQKRIWFFLPKNTDRTKLR